MCTDDFRGLCQRAGAAKYTSTLSVSKLVSNLFAGISKNAPVHEDGSVDICILVEKCMVAMCRQTESVHMSNN